jgi:hypothetical protein
MKLIGATACLAAAISLSASPAGAKPKHSPQHELAVQKCSEAYEAAAAAAHAPNSPKGEARKRAMHAAAEAKKGCIARAPK